MLCSIVLAQLMPTKPHCSMWNSFCTAAEFPSGCRVLCAHCIAYKGIRKQCKWVLSTDIVRNNTISQQGCDGRYVCCDVGFAEEEEGGGGILKRMKVLQVVLNSCSILFLPSNASRANYTAGLQPKKFRPSLRFSPKLFLFSRFCHLMSDIASDLVLFLPSNALHSNYTTWLQPKKV